MAQTQIDDRARMTALASQFHVLRNAPGIAPWDLVRLDEWAISGVSDGERHAAAFVLHVWNAHHQWQVGRFDAIEALLTWDKANREAFLEWVKNPYWM
jgi:hypothetical protein